MACKLIIKLLPLSL